MHTTKMIVTVGIALLFLAAAAIAQTTYTFAEVENPTWKDPINWTPTGPPVASDTAIIPAGETCIVRDANQAAEVIQVAGTLGIDGKVLRLGDDNNPTTSTLSGTLYFTKVRAIVKSR